MKQVTIPADMRPFRCSINGCEYEYPAGSTQYVPDEVASYIAGYNAGKAKPREYPPTPPVLPPITAGDEDKVAKVSGGKVVWAEDASGDTLPAIGDGDDGKVLTAVDGEAAWAAPASPETAETTDPPGASEEET